MSLSQPLNQPYPYHQATPPNPPMLVSFREGVTPGKESKEKQLEVAKQYFKEFLCSMHSGRVAECIMVWHSDDVEWSSERMPLPLSAKGKLECCDLYNTVVDKVMGGPQSTVTMHLDDVRYIPQLDVIKVDFTSSIMKSGAIAPYVDSKRFTIQFNDEMLVTKKIVTPQDSYSMSIGACPQACIAPIVQRSQRCVPQSPTTPRETVSDSSSSSGGISEDATSVSTTQSLPLQPPVTDRPCLHNNWDSVRVKRGHALLRCRTCASQWKLPSTDVKRCPKYLNQDCRLGTLCSHLHVNSRKQTYEERTGTKLAES